MAYTPIPHGTTDWDVPLNAALVDQDTRITANTNNIVTQSDMPSYLVDNHGAVGDGVTNDQPAIQALINSTPAGATILLGAKAYGLASPLIIPPFKQLRGPHGNRTDNVQVTSILKVLSSFSGTAAIRLLDKEEGGYSGENEGVRITNLTVDGSAGPASVAGLIATGLVHGVVLDRVCFQSMTGRGVSCSTYTRIDTSVVHPYSWNLWNCFAWQCGDRGFSLGNQQTDCTLINCEALGNTGDGFFMVSCNNSQVTSCRAEFNLNGFHISGSWGTGQGSGGVVMTGCSTDRNTQNGVLIDSTGNASHLVSGLMARRDGRNAGAGGGGFAGLNVTSATTPVVVSGMTCYPGLDDNGAGTNSPQYGFTASGSTAVTVSSSYLHANTAGFFDGGTNTLLRRNTNVLTASGTTSAPTRDTSTPWNTNGQGTLSLNTVDQAALSISNSAANTGLALIDVTGSANTSRALGGQVTGDSTRRLDIRVDGLITIGPGNATRDVTLSRGAANRLDLTATDLRIGTAGRGLQVASGANAKAGTVTANGVTAVTVNTTAITANSVVVFGLKTALGTAPTEAPYVSAVTAGSQFQVQSSAGDLSVYNWIILDLF